MDIDINHVIWGLVGVVVVRKLWNMIEAQENRKRDLEGHPVEMRDTDPTSLGMPVVEARGSYAKRV